MERTEILKGLIKGTGLSLRSFSEKAGLPYTTVRSILERGIENSSIDKVMKICHALGITIDELLEMDKPRSEDEVTIETIAAHNDGPPLTDEEQEKLREYAIFLKSQRNG
jgi:transcriptional regulator with XRE-family HTH domain